MSPGEQNVARIWLNARHPVMSRLLGRQRVTQVVELVALEIDMVEKDQGRPIDGAQAEEISRRVASHVRKSRSFSWWHTLVAARQALMLLKWWVNNRRGESGQQGG